MTDQKIKAVSRADFEWLRRRVEGSISDKGLLMFIDQYAEFGVERGTVCSMLEGMEKVLTDDGEQIDFTGIVHSMIEAIKRSRRLADSAIIWDQSEGNLGEIVQKVMKASDAAREGAAMSDAVSRADFDLLRERANGSMSDESLMLLIDRYVELGAERVTACELIDTYREMAGVMAPNAELEVVYTQFDSLKDYVHKHRFCINASNLEEAKVLAIQGTTEHPPHPSSTLEVHNHNLPSSKIANAVTAFEGYWEWLPLDGIIHL